MLTFTPKSEEELLKDMLWPEGQYAFQVLEAQQKPSKSGNEMIVIKMILINSSNQNKTINDYLMCDLSSQLLKLRNFCHTVGLGNQFESGRLCAEDCIGKEGILELKRVGERKVGDAVYPPANNVKDYVVSQKAKSVAVKQDEFKDDDLPF